MKFVHMADMHFDAPFTVLNTRGLLGEKRRLEQREIFKRIIEYIKENKIEYLFIAGDLYEHEYIRETTIEYMNQLFADIPNTKIFIAPGNHDPYLKNSMYTKFNWSNNVKIFTSNLEIVENENIDIYGIGFDNFYSKGLGVEEIQLKNREKINILITHGSLNGGSNDETEYNPMNINKLKLLGFDYIALGHIHKTNYQPGANIVYSGSTIAFGFDELGEHGIITGEINKGEIKTEFVPVDTKEFKEIELDITNIPSQEELIEKINSLNLHFNIFYKLILIGERNFEIKTQYLYQFIKSENIIKIKDKTKIGVDLNEIAQEMNLKGLYVKEILEDKNLDDEVKEKIIEIGLEILNS